MNFTFRSSLHGTCIVKLWATGRHGFSLPKRVDIAVADGAIHTYVYYNRKVQLKPELANRAIVRIAVACFDAGNAGAAVDAEGMFEIVAEMPAWEGTLTPTRTNTPRAPLRVRPGRAHGRMKPELRIGEVDCEMA